MHLLQTGSGLWLVMKSLIFCATDTVFSLTWAAHRIGPASGLLEAILGAAGAAMAGAWLGAPRHVKLPGRCGRQDRRAWSFWHRELEM